MLAACTAGGTKDEGPDAEDVVDTEDVAVDTEGEAVTEDVPVSETAVLLSDADRLMRIAMTLLGVRPSAEDYAALAADPEVLGELVDGYLADPRFGDTVRDIENQTLLVRREKAGGVMPDVDMSSLAWSLALNEEPLRMIQYVVEHDLPYTDVVTMHGTVGSSVHAELWAGVEDSFDPDGEPWQVYAYTDGRPQAGVLSTSGWHQRWASNPNNAKRLAAAAAMRSLICVDYFSGDVQLGSVDLSDDDAIDRAILEEPACVSCHQTMDPVAGNLQGFGGRPVFNAGYPNDPWRPQTVDDGFRFTGRENGYYGLGGSTLEEMGVLIAGDSRFSQCTARRYLAWMTQTPLDAVDEGRVRVAQAALVDNQMNLKAMVRQIVLADAFAVSHDADAEAAEHTVGMLQTRPTQLDRFFRDLTGFTWTSGFNRDGHPFNVATTATRGFRVHGGGIDSENKVTPVHLYSAPSSAFLRSFAAEAAGHVVSSDFPLPRDQRVLLTEVDLETTDEAALRAQLAVLHHRVYGELVDVDSEAVSDTYGLLQALLAESRDAEDAWKVLLLAMFQDLRVAYH
jgi:hypothetical protein